MKHNHVHILYIFLIATILSACTPQVPLPPNEQGGKLQFKSGFEGTTHITGEISTTSNKDNWIEGVDMSVPNGLGDWSSLKTGDYLNLDWVVQAYGFFQGGRMETVQDPTGADNQVLRLRNTNVIDGVSRSQWALNQAVYWRDDGTPNKFDKQFYRYRMYIPSDITSVPSFSSWSKRYMIWESHAWSEFSGGEKTRYDITLQKKPNSSLWYFRAVQSRPEGCNTFEGPTSSCTVYWDNKEHQDIPVPFDQWFTFEVFFKYHQTEGEWYVAITREGEQRQELAHYVGQTKFDEKLHDQMIMKMYHNREYTEVLGETNQYYDDLEIWSDYPPGYFVPGIYVSTTGNDSNPGTFEQPYKTISKAASVVTAGNTIYVRGGVYVESVSINNSGTEANPIRLMAYPGEIPVIDGQTKLGANFGYLLRLYGDYI